MDVPILPFAIDVPAYVLSDLRSRLRRTRWPDAELVDDRSQGIRLGWLKDLCTYWTESYDWRAREILLNRFAQFMTAIDGVDIHFIHARSKEPQALPLLMTHGWPGSIVEFQKVIGPLTDPVAHGGNAADAFHVVCPSLPGFGFSGKPLAAGWNIDRIAAAWAALMARLGYGRYAAQGGDWGSSITAALGAEDAAHLVGIHVTLAFASRPQDGLEADAGEQEALRKLKHYQDDEYGYALLQATRPQTIGVALHDSPAGQAAWILEKFHAWTDAASIVTRDELLDNVMTYWVNGNATSSARLYWESRGARRLDRPIDVPTGVAVYPAEIVPPVRRWMDSRFRDIRHWRQMPRGGHFAAFEQPELFVADLRDCFRSLR